MSGQGERTIHTSAIVEPGAELGAGVDVGPFSFIQAGARIGDRCRIGPHAVIFKGVTLGPGCTVHACAVLGDVPQDRGFDGTESFVRIGANARIREGVTIHRGTKPGTSTDIGDDAFLMANSHFAHNVRLGNGVVVANGALLAGYVEVGDKTFISGNVVIHQFVRIGRLAMLGGGSAISKDVPPFATVAPAELNTVAGLNVVGMRRAGMGTPERTEIRRAFKMLYVSGLNVSQALAKLKETFPSGFASELWKFAEESKRGLCGARFAAGAEAD